MKKLGLIAGNSDLPLQVRNFCKENNIDLYVTIVKGFGDPSQYDNFIELKFGQVGKAIKYFKDNKVDQLVFAGGVKKPSFFNIFEIGIDLKGLKLLKKILNNRFLGDNSVLETVVNFFQDEGLKILEIDKILKNVKFSKGFNTSENSFDQEFLKDIELGKNVLEKLSDLDIGQSIAIQQKNVLGIECVEGTEELIKRCKNIKYKNGRKPILVKMKKINQTRKADLPTVGINTIEQLHDAGFAGLVVDSENCLVILIEKVLDLAKKYHIFVYGL